MDREKEIERMAGDICNYVRSKGVTSVSVVANSPYIKYLHNTGIAEWLIEKGYGDVRAAVREEDIAKVYGIGLVRNSDKLFGISEQVSDHADKR